MIFFGYSGSWILGESGETCEQVCSKKGQYCNAEQQSAVITSGLVKEKMAEAGYICKGFHAASDVPGTPFSTGRKDDDCAPIVPGIKSQCNKMYDPTIRSLCYCDKGKMSYKDPYWFKSLK